VIYVFSYNCSSAQVFTRKSSYCFQRVLAITILSVCLSHGWISQKRCKLGSPNLYRFRNRKAFP